MSSKYEEIDSRIMDLINAGCNEFSRICVQMKDQEWRTIDRRLQAMRKRGVIIFKGAGWGWRTVK